MAEIIPFPRPPLEPGDTPVTKDDEPVVRCEGIMHVFATGHARCQCGEEIWETIADNDLIGIRQP